MPGQEVDISGKETSFQDTIEHSYSLPVEDITSGLIACPYCGRWVSKSRYYILEANSFLVPTSFFIVC